MGTEKLSERLRATLEHLKQAKELGSTLSEYAAVFNLDVKELYNGRTQLQHKGLWPKVRKSSPRQPQLLAVEVSAQNGSAVPAPMNEWDVAAHHTWRMGDGVSRASGGVMAEGAVCDAG